MTEVEKKIGYSFKNKLLLKTALTHSSYGNEHRCRNYERLEFLGDSILSYIVSSYLFSEMKDINEGDLSKIRSSLVCEEALAKLARRLEIGNAMLLGNGEEKSGSRDRNSILADMFEATLAAVYLDSSLENAQKIFLGIMREELENAVKYKVVKDYKSSLQEKIQKKSHGKTQILYNVIKESGPEHDKTFVVELLLNAKRVATGQGGTKKEAEQEAARMALTEGKL